MIIGIDASRANRDHKSGTEWYSYYLIRWLAKLDKDNQYILYTDKPLRDGLLDLTTKQHIDASNNISGVSIEYDKDGFQILKSPYGNFKAKILKWPFDFLWTQGRMSLEMIFNKPDVLFIPSHVLPLIHPHKSILTLHDIGFKRYDCLYRREYIGPEKKWLREVINFIVKLITFGKCRANSLDYHIWSTRYALRNAKKIITVSRFSKKELIDVYGNDKNRQVLDNKIKVVYNGYNKLIYRKIEDREKLKRVLNKYDIQEPYILYVGRLEKKKNTPALIEAFAIMREKNKNIHHKLVLAGDASFGYDEVKYQIQEYSLDDEVIMPGWIEENDMPYIYSGASVFVFPSLYEGFGIPIIQAMACEVPVVASNAASIPEISAGAALLFDPNDVYSMAEAIKNAITKSELRDSLIKKGRERVKNFNWEKTAKETLSVIKTIGSN
jgi:glycosyltransferase involved in cell wall biosynthesis